MRHVVPVPRLSRETKGFVVDMRLHRHALSLYGGTDWSLTTEARPR